ncbi:transposase, partial [Actinomyces oris]|uniref:transposase n=1 Tax=Actinomyces oris TaxID=544580 RepID=UPI001177D1F4
PAAKYSEEFKAQVVREVIEKDRTIASVAASYGLVAQTVGNWVARYKKEHATDLDRKKASESAEIAKLRAEVRELRGENEFLKKAAAFVCPERKGAVDVVL